jgi:hypothetical protein
MWVAILIGSALFLNWIIGKVRAAGQAVMRRGPR